jgi:hypothetical protein
MLLSKYYKTVRVNHPLSYTVIWNNQFYSGLAAQIQISDREGYELYHGNMALF